MVAMVRRATVAQRSHSSVQPSLELQPRLQHAIQNLAHERRAAMHKFLDDLILSATRVHQYKGFRAQMVSLRVLTLILLSLVLC